MSKANKEDVVKSILRENGITVRAIAKDLGISAEWFRMQLKVADVDEFIPRVKAAILERGKRMRIAAQKLDD